MYKYVISNVLHLFRAGSALMIVSSTEYANSLVTTGPIVDAAFTDLRNYVSNTWTQIFDETDGLAVGIFEDVQTKLTSQMSCEWISA